MNSHSNWFEVDRAGLARIAARRTKTFMLRELIQNAWDEPSGTVSVEVYAPVNGSGFSTIRVTDDAPDGFADLRHAYTLFAPSAKVTDAGKRGRFNFGEKLVLALCAEARIETTTGTVLFDRGEKRRRSPKRREKGSMFEGQLRLNAEERGAIIKAAQQMIPPPDRKTFVNGEEIFPRKSVVEFNHYLETEVAGDEGTLRSTVRETQVRVFEAMPGEEAHLYEMGIPVVKTGDRWHVDVGQKVPLNMERDNVPPRWLADVRAAVANHTAELLTTEDANAPWARDALSHYEIKPDTVKKLVELRFGDRAVIADPSDPEATNKAVAEGYVVVHGGQLSSEEWVRVKGAGALIPAGQVFPTPRPFSPDGSPLKLLPTEEWTEGMRRFAAFAIKVASTSIGHKVVVMIANDSGWSPLAAFGPDGILYLNLKRLGYSFFAEIGTEKQLDLLIHEFGHHVEGNHLSEKYHEALCRIGAKIARLAVERPELFKC